MKAPWRLTLVAVLAVLAAACTTTSAPTGAPSPGTSTAKAASPASAARFADPPDKPLSDSVAALLQAEMERWVTLGYIPGVTAAIVTDHGTWVGAAGVDGSGAELVPESAMYLASISKTFTAAEVLTLAADGRVDLDAPVSTYVHSKLADNGATVRQLLSMRSGLAIDNIDYGSGVFSRLLGKPGRHWTVQEALANITGQSSKPDQVFVYNNVNYWLLSQLVTEVTGIEFADALRRDLIDPAGVERVAVQDGERIEPPLALPGDDDPQATRRASDPFLPSRALASFSLGIGSIAADAASVARWGYLLYGGHVLPASVSRLMTGIPENDYGIGTMKLEANGDDAVGHLGEFLGYRTTLFVIPEHQLALALLTPSSKQTYSLVPYLLSAADLP